MNATKKIFSIKEVADLLGVDRVTVYRWVKSGKVKAEMIGGAYVISVVDLPHHFIGGLSEDKKIQIRDAVAQALEQYGETFRALAQE
ncbi:MAG: helix-turn-helix domain-containing protein [Candidatus Uhrbacteria bacterium]|nr:helix-turn-helix domain-containing protein [Candidatus Uhrbacteria bacterium]